MQLPLRNSSTSVSAVLRSFSIVSQTSLNLWSLSRTFLRISVAIEMTCKQCPTSLCRLWNFSSYSGSPCSFIVDTVCDSMRSIYSQPGQAALRNSSTNSVAARRFSRMLSQNSATQTEHDTIGHNRQCHALCRPQSRPSSRAIAPCWVVWQNQGNLDFLRLVGGWRMGGESIELRANGSTPCL